MTCSRARKATVALVGRQMPGNLDVVDQGPDALQRSDVGEPRAGQPYLDARRRLEEAWARSQELMDQIEKGRSRRDRLYDSAYARLNARLASMPVIEQAKGILMAQTGCGAQEAFDMLRRASQRSNVRIRDLAGEIVRRAEASGGSRTQGRTRATQDGTATGQAQRRSR